MMAHGLCVGALRPVSQNGPEEPLSDFSGPGFRVGSRAPVAVQGTRTYVYVTKREVSCEAGLAALCAVDRDLAYLLLLCVKFRFSSWFAKSIS